MSFAYSGDPSDSNKDAVRFHIGDTSTTDQQLQDEEINYLLSLHTTVHATSIAAVEAIIAKYSRLVDKAVGDLRVSYSQRIDQYQTLLQTLRRRGTLDGGVTPLAVNVSIDEKDANREDSDIVQPAFRRGMHDYEGILDDELTED